MFGGCDRHAAGASSTRASGGDFLLRPSLTPFRFRRLANQDSPSDLTKPSRVPRNSGNGAFVPPNCRKFREAQGVENVLPLSLPLSPSSTPFRFRRLATGRAGQGVSHVAYRREWTAVTIILKKLTSSEGVRFHQTLKSGVPLGCPLGAVCPFPRQRMRDGAGQAAYADESELHED